MAQMARRISFIAIVLTSALLLPLFAPAHSAAATPPSRDDIEMMDKKVSGEDQERDAPSPSSATGLAAAQGYDDDDQSDASDEPAAPNNSEIDSEFDFDVTDESDSSLRDDFSESDYELDRSSPDTATKFSFDDEETTDGVSPDLTPKSVDLAVPDDDVMPQDVSTSENVSEDAEAASTEAAPEPPAPPAPSRGWFASAWSSVKASVHKAVKAVVEPIKTAVAKVKEFFNGPPHPPVPSWVRKINADAKKSNDNCAIAAVKFEQGMQGQISPRRLPALDRNGERVLEHVSELFPGVHRQDGDRAKFERDLLAKGEGARAIVRGKWFMSHGHAMNAHVHNGKVVYLDAQKGDYRGSLSMAFYDLNAYWITTP